MIVELEARQELRRAADWYENQRVGLGEEFLAEVDVVVTRIELNPLSFPIDPFDERARRALVARFPFAVVYVLVGGDIRVIAVAHTKRRPGYWSSRV